MGVDFIDFAFQAARRCFGGAAEIDAVHIVGQALVEGYRRIHQRVGRTGGKQPVMVDGTVIILEGFTGQQVDDKHITALAAAAVIVGGSRAEGDHPIPGGPGNLAAGGIL
jgi:hypothetical protein